MVDVHSIGAGGGCIAWFDSGGLLRVGPQSAGATPGPACYGRGGSEPTVTDANVVLGYLDPDFFLGGEMQLDRNAARRGGRPHRRPARCAERGGRLRHLRRRQRGHGRCAQRALHQARLRSARVPGGFGRRRRRAACRRHRPQGRHQAGHDPEIRLGLLRFRHATAGLQPGLRPQLFQAPRRCQPDDDRRPLCRDGGRGRRYPGPLGCGAQRRPLRAQRRSSLRRPVQRGRGAVPAGARDRREPRRIAEAFHRSTNRPSPSP